MKLQTNLLIGKEQQEEKEEKKERHVEKKVESRQTKHAKQAKQMHELPKKRVAVIRIKGKPGLRRDVKETFYLMRLYKKNNCTIIPNTPSYIGMLNKIKDSTTWGEIDFETIKQLLQKRGKLPGNRPLTEQYVREKLNCTLDEFIKEYMDFKREITDIPGLKPFFKLNPPRKGFEAKGVKVQFSMGGVLGYRKDKINDLIRRMV